MPTSKGSRTKRGEAEASSGKAKVSQEEIDAEFLSEDDDEGPHYKLNGKRLRHLGEIARLLQDIGEFQETFYNPKTPPTLRKAVEEYNGINEKLRALPIPPLLTQIVLQISTGNSAGLNKVVEALRVANGGIENARWRPPRRFG